MNQEHKRKQRVGALVVGDAPAEVVPEDASVGLRATVSRVVKPEVFELPTREGEPQSVRGIRLSTNLIATGPNLTDLDSFRTPWVLTHAATGYKVAELRGNREVALGVAGKLEAILDLSFSTVAEFGVKNENTRMRRAIDLIREYSGKPC